MGKRRKLRGKKLLFVSGALAGVALLGCGDDGGMRDSAVANLILPPEDSAVMDSSNGDGAAEDSAAGDAASDAPSDTGAGDAASEGSATDGSAGDGSADA